MAQRRRATSPAETQSGIPFDRFRRDPRDRGDGSFDAHVALLIARRRVTSATMLPAPAASRHPGPTDPFGARSTADPDRPRAVPVGAAAPEALREGLMKE